MATVLSTLYPPLIDTFMPAFPNTQSAVVHFTVSPYNSSYEIQYLHVTLVDQRTNRNAFATDANVETPDGTALINGIWIIPFSESLAGNDYNPYLEMDREANYYTLYIPPAILKLNEEETRTFVTNSYYKLQLRFDKFVSDEYGWSITNANSNYISERRAYFSEWSSVCLLKAIPEITVNLNNFTQASDIHYASKIATAVTNLSSTLNLPTRVPQYVPGIIPFAGNLVFAGDANNTEIDAKTQSEYYRRDIYTTSNNEYLMSYRITIWDELEALIKDSGTQYPSKDGKTNSFYWLCDMTEADTNVTYTVTLDFTTNNQYTFSKSFSFTFVEPLTTGFNPTFDFNKIPLKDHGIEYDTLVTEEDGWVKLTINNKGTIGTGYLFIKRATSLDNFQQWELIDCYHVKDGENISHTIIDKTVGSLVRYKYACQFLSSKGNWTRSFISTEIVYPDFHDILLSRGDKQLAIRYNEQITNLTPVVNRVKIDTLGGRYPRFAENAKLHYKQFQLNGLITAESDFNRTFLNDLDFAEDMKVYDDQMNGTYMIRNDTVREPNILYTTDEDGQIVQKTNGTYSAQIAKADTTVNKQIRDTQKNTKHDLYPTDNWWWERKFREEVMEWLNDGEPKLYRSMTEGNLIVMLDGISLTPNAQLGRRIWNFSCTVYEVGDGNSLDELDALGIYPVNNSYSTDLTSEENGVVVDVSRQFLGQTYSIIAADTNQPTNLVDRGTHDYTYKISTTNSDGQTIMLDPLTIGEQIGNLYSGLYENYQVNQGSIRLKNLKIQFESLPQWYDLDSMTPDGSLSGGLYLNIEQGGENCRILVEYRNQKLTVVKVIQSTVPLWLSSDSPMSITQFLTEWENAVGDPYYEISYSEEDTDGQVIMDISTIISRAIYEQIYYKLKDSEKRLLNGRSQRYYTDDDLKDGLRIYENDQWVQIPNDFKIKDLLDLSDEEKNKYYYCFVNRPDEIIEYNKNKFIKQACINFDIPYMSIDDKYYYKNNNTLYNAYLDNNGSRSYIEAGDIYKELVGENLTNNSIVHSYELQEDVNDKNIFYRAIKNPEIDEKNEELKELKDNLKAYEEEKNDLDLIISILNSKIGSFTEETGLYSEVIQLFKELIPEITENSDVYTIPELNDLLNAYNETDQQLTFWKNEARPILLPNMTDDSDSNSDDNDTNNDDTNNVVFNEYGYAPISDANEDDTYEYKDLFYWYLLKLEKELQDYITEAQPLLDQENANREEDDKLSFPPVEKEDDQSSDDSQSSDTPTSKKIIDAFNKVLNDEDLDTPENLNDLFDTLNVSVSQGSIYYQVLRIKEILKDIADNNAELADKQNYSETLKANILNITDIIIPDLNTYIANLPNYIYYLESTIETILSSPLYYFDDETDEYIEANDDIENKELYYKVDDKYIKITYFADILNESKSKYFKSEENDYCLLLSIPDEDYYKYNDGYVKVDRTAVYYQLRTKNESSDNFYILVDQWENFIDKDVYYCYTENNNDEYYLKSSILRYKNEDNETEWLWYEDSEENGLFVEKTSDMSEDLIYYYRTTISRELPDSILYTTEKIVSLFSLDKDDIYIKIQNSMNEDVYIRQDTTESSSSTINVTKVPSPGNDLVKIDTDSGKSLTVDAIGNQEDSDGVVSAYVEQKIEDTFIKNNCGLGYKLRLTLISPHDSSSRLERTIFVNERGYYQVPSNMTVTEVQLFDGAKATLDYILEYDLQYEDTTEPNSYEAEEDIVGQVSGMWIPGTSIAPIIQKKYWSYDQEVSGGPITQQSVDSWKAVSFDGTPYTILNIQYTNSAENMRYVVGRSGVLNLETDYPTANIYVNGKRMVQAPISRQQYLDEWEYVLDPSVFGGEQEQSGEEVSGAYWWVLYNNEFTSETDILVKVYLSDPVLTENGWRFNIEDARDVADFWYELDGNYEGVSEILTPMPNTVYGIINSAGYIEYKIYYLDQGWFNIEFPNRADNDYSIAYARVPVHGMINYDATITRKVWE